MSRFAACFEALPDPRSSNARHPLTSILFIAIAAIICGAESCTDMEDFGHSKRRWLKSIVPLPHGIPSHDTFSTVFRHLDTDAFEAAFRRLTATFAKGIEGVVAIDGKAVRGAYRRGAKATPLHLVNVWAAGAGLVIGQKTAPNRNEVQGVLDALALLTLDGATVTADALHCRADTARAILATGADYVLALKDNQPSLLKQVKALIEDGDHIDSILLAPKTAHDRTETRRASVVAATSLDFPGLQAAGSVETACRHADGTQTSHVRFFLLSRIMSPNALIETVRTHWHIENKLHWVLDVHFCEDAARNRKDNGPQNIALLRKIALNVIRSHPDKASIRRKIKKAGWDEDFLTSLISHMR